MVLHASSDETLDQFSYQENDIFIDQEDPDDARYPEVSCIVCTCPQTQFINIMGANCRNVVCLPVPKFSYVEIRLQKH
jgi:hypothetical protein